LASSPLAEDPMEFYEALKARRSVRRFSSRAVEEEKLKRLCEAVISAPSAYNLQSYQVFIVKDRERKYAISRSAFDQNFTKQNFIAEAPVLLVFCADPNRCGSRYGERGSTLYCVQDASIAATFAMLAAVDLGLSTVWVGAFNEDQVMKVVGTDRLRPVAILPIGYSEETPPPTSRRSVDEMFHEV